MTTPRKPKRYICTNCQHTYDRPKRERAVLSDLSTITALVCPKCRKTNCREQNPGWKGEAQ